MDADVLRQYLEYYRDLHVETLYRRTAPVVTAPPAAIPAPVIVAVPPEPKMELPPLAPPNDLSALVLTSEQLKNCAVLR